MSGRGPPALAGCRAISSVSACSGFRACAKGRIRNDDEGSDLPLHERFSMTKWRACCGCLREAARLEHLAQFFQQPGYRTS